MCYSASQLAFRIYKDAVRLGASAEEIEFLKTRWQELEKGGEPNLYHASGYDHPKLAVFSTESDAIKLSQFSWGLIPHWVKDEQQALEIRNKTLNARGESMFEKPAFRDAATTNRIIIPLDGFFEHHHKHGKTFPYFIKRKDQQRMLVAGLSSEWRNPQTNQVVNTMTIVTTRGNEVMSRIHNNPKLKEPRMPLILNDEDGLQWMKGNENEVAELIQPNTEVELETKTVRRLSGNSYIGNRPEVQEEYVYDELNDQLSLF